MPHDPARVAETKSWFAKAARPSAEESQVLATLVRDMVGSRAGIVHAPLPKDDPVRRNPDIALAQKLLGGWTPQVPLERGREATIAYFRGLNGRPQG
jgi:nucleoside-diphosphate-sugar epimerase